MPSRATDGYTSVYHEEVKLMTTMTERIQLAVDHIDRAKEELPSTIVNTDQERIALARARTELRIAIIQIDRVRARL